MSNNKLTCCIFGDFGYADIKTTRKNVMQIIEERINCGARRFLLSNIGIFHAICMSVCVELRSTYPIELFHVCANKEVVEKMEFTIKSIFPNVEVMTFEDEKIPNSNTLDYAIEKMIDESDMIVFYKDKTCKDPNEDYIYAKSYAENRHKDYIYITN